MVQERVEDACLEKNQNPPKALLPACPVSQGALGAHLVPGALSLSAPSKFSFVAAGAELKVTPLGSSPARPLTWGNIRLFPSLGSFPHL